MLPIQDQVILVTGSTDGIGKIAAEKLAGMGAAVLVHGRDPDKSRDAQKRIRESTGNEKVVSYVADFSSLSFVRSLAEEVIRDYSGLHVLINNAGVGPAETSGKEGSLSRDGYELSFAVNYLAPFLLTRLLIPVLEAGAPSRIVNVSSAAQRDIDFEDVMLEKHYDPWRAYAQSKTALTMFTFDAAEELRDKGVNVTCLHPGSLLNTKMVRDYFGSPRGSAEEGAEVVVYVATDPELEGATGIYFEGKREARAHAQVYDLEARERLRRISEELTGVG